MDERLSKAIDFANYTVTLNNQKRLLKEKYQEELIFYHNGCQFTITKEIITFVGLLVDKDNDSVVLTDDNGVPTRIDPLDEFYEEILNIYFTASNDYYLEYDVLKKQRSVEKLVGLEIDEV